MVNLALVPDWFFGYDIILELIFVAITLAVSWYAFKTYKLTGESRSKLFSISFILISLGYFALSLVNFVVFYRAETGISNYLNFLKIQVFEQIGIYIYMILFLSGLLTLAYMTFEKRSKKMYVTLFSLLFVSFVLTAEISFFFYIVSAIFLMVILWYYVKNYLEKKRLNTGLVMSAFILLFIGRSQFIFSQIDKVFYPLGHFLELAAYILILSSLVLAMKK